MAFKFHLRRAQFSKAYAIQPVGGRFPFPTIDSAAIVAKGRFCNSKWAFLNVLQRRNNSATECDANGYFDGAGVQSSAMEVI
jgi:hypothetical protein